MEILYFLAVLLACAVLSMMVVSMVIGCMILWHKYKPIKGKPPDEADSLLSQMEKMMSYNPMGGGNRD